jgi:hypothetical protein
MFNGPLPDLSSLAAESVTVQLLTQLDAKAAVQLLKRTDKLQDILRCVARDDLPTFLAALPTPKESLWTKDIHQWFYLSYGSPFSLMWEQDVDDPRTVTFYDKSSPRKGQHFSTILEVESTLVPALEQHNVRKEAVAELILAAADYFTREAGPDNQWMPHSNVLGSGQEAAQLP